MSKARTIWEMHTLSTRNALILKYFLEKQRRFDGSVREGWKGGEEPNLDWLTFNLL
jgi:hypothetical protein